MIDLTLGRADKEVKIGDIVEMPLSISLACKDAVLEWEWLGIDMQEWPPQRLDWEVYRLEHLSLVSNMESSFASWLACPWPIGYSALRCMACQDWQATHVCPICKKTDRNIGGVHNPWAYFDGCLSHLSTGTRCIGSLLSEDSPSLTGQSMIPTTAELHAQLHPSKCIRHFLASSDHSVHGTWRPSTMADVHHCIVG